MYRKLMFVVAAAVGVSATVRAAPVTYTIDPSHTYPSFEAPHMDYLSLWRGKFNTNSGKITLDREAKTGTVDITIDTASVDFGHDRMNKVALGEDYFNVEKYPTASYTGTIVFKGDTPSQVKGQFTMIGVTKPLDLEIKAFKCVVHPMMKREICGADAYAEFNRGDWGMTANINYGGMVTLRIAAEALQGDQPLGPPAGAAPRAGGPPPQ